MNARSTHSGRSAVTCGIVGHAVREARWSEIGDLRDVASASGMPAVPPRFLRHCDEHTVVGLRAVLDVMAVMQRPASSFARHGVVAASCQPGRMLAARSLTLLRSGGAVTVSTHVVPQCSLHSLAGAVSVGLGMHGPHVGVSGGPDALAEGLFSALTLIQAAERPGADAAGAWLVATEWDDEPRLDADGRPTNDPLCRAVALALEPDGVSAPLGLSVHFPTIAERVPSDRESSVSLASFARALAMCAAGGGALVSWSLVCPWGAEVRFRRRSAAQTGLREAA